MHRAPGFQMAGALVAVVLSSPAWSACGGGEGDAQRFAVGGTVRGLKGSGLALHNNPGDYLPIAANGPFQFAVPVEDGSRYGIFVLSQPTEPSQTCTATGAAGTVSGADIMDVEVECETDTFAVGGTVVGLAGSGLVLRNNGGDDLPLDANGAFAFANALEDGSAYRITVHSQPSDPAQTCRVTGGEGTLDGGDFMGVSVSCDFVMEELSTSRAVVSAGEQVALTWSTRDASGCEIDPGDIVASPTTFGSVEVVVDEPTTFTLHCQSPAGPATRELSIEVTDADWAQFSSGSDHTCAIKQDGRLFCWGEGGSGRLGTNASTAAFAPAQEFSGAEDWLQVSAGGNHTCAVKRDGRLFCWGFGLLGQLGTGSFPAGEPNPVQEDTEAEDWAPVSAGGAHTCAIKQDGRLFCWGSGAEGQLGDGQSSGSSIPVQERTLAEDWAEVSAGGDHTCAIKQDGRLFCWGRGAEGQLGDGQNSESLVPVQEQTHAEDWIQVAAGDRHSCAVKAGGMLFCWGSGAEGQLGDGQGSGSSIPVQEDTLAEDWAEVATSEGHSCAVKQGGELYCWGRGDRGQLGTGTAGGSLIPAREATGAQDWNLIAVGHEHSCAIQQDGELYCWGDSAGGRLGAGSQRAQEATLAGDWARAGAASTRHSCAIKSDGSLYCWGSGQEGQLGQGSRKNELVPVQEVTETRDWAQVATGDEHTCAVKNDGSLFCWGNGAGGRLGTGASDDSLIPAEEATEAGDWAQVAAGGEHTCAIKLDGSLFCWGSGAEGRLGHDSTDDSSVPVQEALGSNDWAQVAAGYQHACAIKSSGRLFCWGNGAGGRLGVGSDIDRLVPTEEFTRAQTWDQVAAAEEHTCAVKKSGSLFCWGTGALGDGSTATRWAPAQEDTEALDWAQVATGDHHTCAVKQDGRLFCWGQDAVGWLGKGAPESSASPIQEATGERNWGKVATGARHTIGVKEDGRIFAWGPDTLGELGAGKLPRPVWPTD